MKEYYVRKGTHTEGPYPAEYIKAGLLRGRYREIDHVHENGHWIRISFIAELVPDEWLIGFDEIVKGCWV